MYLHYIVRHFILLSKLQFINMLKCLLYIDMFQMFFYFSEWNIAFYDMFECFYLASILIFLFFFEFLISIRNITTCTFTNISGNHITLLLLMFVSHNKTRWTKVILHMPLDKISRKSITRLCPDDSLTRTYNR